MRLLSWTEFNVCVQTITELYIENEFSGVYGFPRGGLCLAVAISHSLSIPLLNDPKPNSLVVDDVYETGQTLSQVKEIPSVTAFVWLSKVEVDWWNAVEVCDADEWLVFPWEDPDFADQEKKSFHSLETIPIDTT